MIKLQTWNNILSDRQIEQAKTALSEGNLIIWPTDTLYAIACSALNSKAIALLCRLKNINPEKTNLSIVCSDISMAAEYARIPDFAYRLIRDNTPGPFTFLLRTAQTLPREFKKRKIVGLRIPDRTLCRQLSDALGHPLLTTSLPATDQDEAIIPDLMAERFANQAALIIDAGEGSLEASTIIDCTGDEAVIIREGKGELY